MTDTATSTSNKILYRVLSRIYTNLQKLSPSRLYKTIRRFMRFRSNQQAVTTLNLVSRGHPVRTASQKTAVSKQLARLLVGLLVLSGGGVTYAKREQIRQLVDTVAPSIRKGLDRPSLLRILLNPIQIVLGGARKKEINTSNQIERMAIESIDEELESGNNETFSETGDENNKTSSEPEDKNDDIPSEPEDELENNIKGDINLFLSYISIMQEHFLTPIKGIYKEVLDLKTQNEDTMKSKFNNIVAAENVIFSLYTNACKIQMFLNNSNKLNKEKEQQMEEAKSTFNYINNELKQIEHVEVPDDVRNILNDIIRRENLVKKYIKTYLERKDTQQDLFERIQELDQNITNSIPKDDNLASYCVKVILSRIEERNVMFRTYTENKNNNPDEIRAMNRIINTNLQNVENMNNLADLVGITIRVVNDIIQYKNGIFDSFIEAMGVIRKQITSTIRQNVMTILQNITSNKPRRQPRKRSAR